MIKYEVGQFAYLSNTINTNKRLVQVIGIMDEEYVNLHPSIYTIKPLNAKTEEEACTLLYVYGWQLYPVDVLF